MGVRQKNMTKLLPPLVEKLFAIKSALQNTKGEMDWLYNNTRSIKGYPNNPSATQAVTERFHHVSSGLICIYMFAIIEEFIDPKSPEWEEFLNILDPEDKEKLKAFKHIRNTIAHGFNGARAVRDVDKFDNVMARAEKSKRIQSIVRHNKKIIILGDCAGWECYEFIQNIVRYSLEQAANPVILSKKNAIQTH